MKKHASILFFLIVFVACNSNTTNSAIADQKKTIQNTPADINVESKIFQDSTGWGYDIYLNSKLYIHQPFIPAISGNKPFSTKQDAEKVSQLTISKLQKGINPPTIDLSDLDSLKIKE
jgi:hypothetical protein